MRSVSKLLLIFTLLIPTSLAWSFDFSIGGFGGSDGDSEGSSLDLGKVLDAVKHGKQAFSDISEEEELVIGKDSSSILLGSARLHPDKNLQRYVNRVGKWLAMHTERPNLPWTFAVLDTSSINAFAAPGGYVFITHGLLQRLHSEAELAGVLAHEIAHVLRRHHVFAIKKKARASLATDIVSLTADTSNPAVTDAILNSARDIYSKGLDKDDEFQADHMGVVIAARSGYDPYGLLAVLMTLDSINTENSDFALMFKTHPAPLDRVHKLDDHMGIRMELYADQKQGMRRFQAIKNKISLLNDFMHRF
jgi:predicted Zn-dependent protease